MGRRAGQNCRSSSRKPAPVTPLPGERTPSSGLQAWWTVQEKSPDSLVLADGERGEAWVNLTEVHSRTNVLVVLVPSLALLSVGCQVRIHNADAGVVELEPDRHSSFVTLREGTPKTPVLNLTVAVISTCQLSKCSPFINLHNNPVR